MLLTVKDVVELYQVHPNTVYNWIHNDRLYAFKIGRTWRIPKAELLPPIIVRLRDA